jgi:hypothetical protein
MRWASRRQVGGWGAASGGLPGLRVIGAIDLGTVFSSPGGAAAASLLLYGHWMQQLGSRLLGSSAVDPRFGGMVAWALEACSIPGSGPAVSIGSGGRAAMESFAARLRR